MVSVINRETIAYERSFLGGNINWMDAETIRQSRFLPSYGVYEVRDQNGEIVEDIAGASLVLIPENQSILIAQKKL